MTRRHFFGKRPCEICGAMISNNVRGRMSHMRAHVRDHEAVEKQGAGGLYWQRVEKPQLFIIDSERMGKPSCVLTTPLK